eukprot:TRINITY_DN21489_c0_g1_i1.p2 TRINITY_DN21489_c0_g1~~TRINITY_DN21489_c0_g1_i1.p2  ORF type:complete len:239 (+),score=100.20 TRINITY_DN21489_c0_g1_i1:80-718(+)
MSAGSAEYDAEGNYIGGEAAAPAAAAAAGPARRKRKKRRAAAAAAASDDDSGAAPAAAAALPPPFAEVERPVIAAAAPPAAPGVVAELDADRFPDDPRAQVGKSQADRERQEAQEKLREENSRKIEQMHAALKQAQRQQKKQARDQPSPMGHFSNPASDTRGVVSDGIYFWTNMGLGKMPLKITKQWKLDDARGCETPNPKRARKNFWLPQD